MRQINKIESTPKVIRRADLQDKFLQIYAVASRIEDNLCIELARSANTFALLVKLSNKAIERAVSVNPDFDIDKANYELARYDGDTETLTTQPMHLSSYSRYFLKPKYRRIRKIVFENMRDIFAIEGDISLDFNDLPLGFVRDIFAGLGINYEYRFIVDAIERLSRADTLIFCEDSAPSFGETFVRLPYELFDSWRRAMRRSHTAAVAYGNRAKSAFLRDQVSKLLVSDKGQVAGATQSEDLSLILGERLSASGRRQSIGAATAAVAGARRAERTIAQNEKSELLDLNREIELLTLENLIERLQTHLEKSHSESFWQRFLSENPFILRLAFGIPVAVFGEQVAVGGATFNGTGEKIADFIFRAGNLGNMAIVEIKTPQTALMENSSYRRGVYAPTKHITGAVSQVLDQRYQLQMSINNRKVATRVFDVYTYAIQGLVIAGRDPNDQDAQKSFELFRGNLKDVAVVTFDELLAKLRALHHFLTEDKTPKDLIPASQAG